MTAHDPKTSLWSVSRWWTRIGALLGIATLSWGSWMAAHLTPHVGPCNLPNGLKQPGLAIEVVQKWPDVLQIVGPCEAAQCFQSQTAAVCLSADDLCYKACPDKVDALLSQQRQDRYFILLYWAFFSYLAVLNVRFARIRSSSNWLGTIGAASGMVGGVAVFSFASAAAVYDWIEDDRIVNTLTEVKRYFLSIETESNSVNVSTVMHSFMIPTDRVVVPFNNVKAHVLTAMIPPIRDAAYHKWLFLFISIGCAVPLFTFWLGKTGRAMERKSLSSLLLCGATAVLGITAAFTGIAAWKYGQDQRLQTATATLFLCLPVATITLMVAQTWHSGMLPSLDRLASLPVFQWLSRPAEERREKDDSQDVSHT